MDFIGSLCRCSCARVLTALEFKMRPSELVLLSPVHISLSTMLIGSSVFWQGRVLGVQSYLGLLRWLRCLRFVQSGVLLLCRS